MAESHRLLRVTGSSTFSRIEDGRLHQRVQSTWFWEPWQNLCIPEPLWLLLFYRQSAPWILSTLQYVLHRFLLHLTTWAKEVGFPTQQEGFFGTHPCLEFAAALGISPAVKVTVSPSFLRQCTASLGWQQVQGWRQRPQAQHSSQSFLMASISFLVFRALM